MPITFNLFFKYSIFLSFSQDQPRSRYHIYNDYHSYFMEYGRAFRDDRLDFYKWGLLENNTKFRIKYIKLEKKIKF